MPAERMSPSQMRRAQHETMRRMAQDADHPQVRRELETRLTEMLAAGGVGEGRTALELIYMVPDQFRTAYMRLFHEALGMADGGSGARGRSADETARVGRATGRAARAGGKTFKERWVVRSDDALALKHRVDKRLRGIAREILEELDGGGDGEGAVRPRCPRCSGIVSGGWLFCSTCGQNLREV